MDNVTHSLAGAVLAELGLATLGRELRSRYRALTQLASISANNLPDFDFLYVGITEGKLGYLLHHRGHTHTLLVACALGLGQALLLGFWLGRRKWQRNALGLVVFLSLLGPVLHLGLDFTNNYGLHPFWPWDNRWYYGDAVFIVEPYLLLIFSGTLFGAVHSLPARGLFALLGALTLGLSVLLPIPWQSSALLSGLALLFLVAGWRRQEPRWSFGLGLAALAAFYLTMWTSRQLTERSVREALHPQAPQLRVLDVVKTPAPASPYCWQVFVVARDEQPGPTAAAGDYRVLSASVSHWPSVIPPERCPGTHGDATAPLGSSALADTAKVSFAAEYRVPLSLLRELAGNCWFAALLRFARTPFVDPHSRVVGDLRYDRDAELGFSEFELPSTGPCPEHVPPWLAPRADLLEPALTDQLVPRVIGNEDQ